MDAAPPLLRLERIDKRFPGVHALDRVDFDLQAGEVHVLLGENGAGKSTLMKILSGVLSPDSGRIVVGSQTVDRLTPDSAQRLGIGLVHQELSLVPGLSVAENLFLGRLPRNRLGRVQWRTLYARAETALAELGVRLDPRAEIRTLDVGEQQIVEIARVLARQPRILLLDEPTSALSDAERTRLFAVIRRLQGSGVGIIYISHHLAEVPLIGQRVTVLRDGRVVGTLPVERAGQDELIGMMVGRRLTERYPKAVVVPGEPVLRVEDLWLDGVLHGLSFTLRRGEILGVFGLMGAGQAELARALFGLEAGATARIAVEGRPAGLRRPSDAIARRMGFITRDRRQGLVPLLPIPPNTTLAWLADAGPFRRLDLRREEETAGRYVRELRIQPASLRRPVLYLSGGNQQKVVLSRWLSSDARILIFDEPTRGIDVGAKAEVFALMSRLVRDGAAILMISSELPELLGMADRVLVLRAGRIAAELPREGLSQEALLRHAS